MVFGALDLLHLSFETSKKRQVLHKAAQQDVHPVGQVGFLDADERDVVGVGLRRVRGKSETQRRQFRDGWLPAAHPGGPWAG